jgi:hypothetical protein
MTESRTGLATTARAFATYSLVPYLGILFCPGAVVVGSLGIVRSYRSDPTGIETARGVCYGSAIVGLFVMAIQALLWWILYKVPVWARGF